MFRTELAKQLIRNFNNRKCPGRPSLVASSKQICSDHFSRKLEQHRKCDLCYTKKIRTDTIWACPSCNIALCHTGNDDSRLLFEIPVVIKSLVTTAMDYYTIHHNHMKLIIYYNNYLSRMIVHCFTL